MTESSATKEIEAKISQISDDEDLKQQLSRQILKASERAKEVTNELSRLRELDEESLSRPVTL